MEKIKAKGRELQICTKCIYDETVSGISFDSEGICNYCRTMESLIEEYGTGKTAGKSKLKKIIYDVKKAGAGKRYDCIIGVSGGTDSSFLIAKMVKWGLRPLAVHYDNGWNSSIASENMKKVLGRLNVDLYTYRVDDKEANDIFLSFLKAGVPEVDASTDLAIAEVMYRAAAKHGVKYVFEGHSFMTEGISPLSNMYFDGKYIRSIHEQFGKLPMKTYPLMTFLNFMKWILFYRIRKIRPFWYINYSKEKARKYLAKEFDWQYYGGHHLENQIVAFQHSYHNYHKFGMDNRNLSLAAGVRSGLIDRNEAIREYFFEEPYLADRLLDSVKEKLHLSADEFEALMKLPNHRYTDYPTYKGLFKSLKPLFYILAKLNLVPMSFYLKYTA